MTLELSLHNLLAWAAQASLLCLAGAALPVIFRISHPRSLLAYCRVVLLAAIVIPWIQPWQPADMDANGRLHDFSNTQISDSVTAIPAPRSWTTIAGGILAAGMAARLLWMLAGLVQLRRYRKAARPLESLPEPIRWAQRTVNRSAVVLIAGGGKGPAAFGFLRPVVLLTESFFLMDEDAQRSIACHEFLHVRRNDWLATVFEELAAACLWFHPAAWRLLSQAKLAREQIVDAEVVRLTGMSDPYIDALLTMSGVQPGELSPAASFFRKRYLVRRLRHLLMDKPASKRRLAGSYVAAGLLLSFVGAAASAAFPLKAPPAAQQSLAPVRTVENPPPLSGALPERLFRVGGGVTAPRLATRVEPEYPASVRQSFAQGSVIVRAIVQTDGSMHVVRILRSLTPELDRSALAALNQWRFEPAMLDGAPVPVELHVQVDFSL